MANELASFRPVADFQQARGRRNVNRANEFNLQQAQQNAPRQNALADIQLRGAQQGEQAANRQSGIVLETQKLQFMNQAAKALRGVPFEARPAAFSKLSALAGKVGIDPQSFSGVELSDQNLDQMILSSESFIQNPQSLEQAKLDLRERELKQRRDLILARPDIAGDTERKKLEAQKGRKADIAGEVKLAQENASLLADQAKTNKSNEVALNVYNVALSGLVSGLGGTDTGPIWGRLPNISSDRKIADGAVAAMLPILKSMFRSAGEGTFTDQDQKLLTDMIPTTKDSPKTIKAKLENIDAIVQAKLGPREAAQAVQPAAPQQGVQPAAPQQGVDIQALTQEAEAAIAAGAPRDAVMQRLQQMTGGQ